MRREQRFLLKNNFPGKGGGRSSLDIDGESETVAG